MADRTILYACAVLRSLGTSLLGVLLGVYLARLQLGPAEIGLIIGVGLAGAAAAALLVTFAGDRMGRRRTLVALAVAGAVGTCVVASSSTASVLAAAAFVGMLNGMGRDRGAALVLDQAILPATTGDRNRTRGFAWYNVLQDAANAIGALLAASTVLLRDVFELDGLISIRLVILLNALLLLASAVLYSRLSPAAEAETPTHRVSVSDDSRRALWKISALFGIDSLAGGFLTASLLSYFFFERFGASEGMIGLLFFGARVANAASHLGAAWLASRIGLVNTMVFTHIPSSLLLATVAFAPSFPIAAALFLLREGLVEMDVPTRQSYVMAMVKPEERTFASGITNLVRLGGWAAAPAFAGWLMQGASLVAPLFVGAAMKISYDVTLFLAFRHRRPPEEEQAPKARPRAHIPSWIVAAFLSATLICASGAKAADAMPLTVEAKIPLGDIEGRMDHLAFDPGRGLIYVAELGNDTVGIVDFKARRVLRTVEGFKEPQGIAWEPGTDTIYVASGGDGTVRLFSGADFSPLGSISLGSDADNVRVDRATGRVYVGYGDGALAIIDAASRKRIGDIGLKGHPESFQLDPNGNSIFVNVPDAGHIAVVARDSGKQVGSWETGSLRANYPLAVDAGNQRVIAIFRQPAKLQAYSTPSGRVVASADVCTDSDDVFVDSKRHCVYVVCGGGQVDTFESVGNTYSRIGRLPTSAGSRTGLFISELDRLVVAVRASGREPAALWILKPTP